MVADDISALQNNLLHSSAPGSNSFDHSRPTGSSCVCTWHQCNNTVLWLTLQIYCNCLYDFAIVGNIDIWYSFIHIAVTVNHVIKIVYYFISHCLY